MLLRGTRVASTSRVIGGASDRKWIESQCTANTTTLQLYQRKVAASCYIRLPALRATLSIRLADLTCNKMRPGWPTKVCTL